jgi:hypothetical protein
MKRWIAGMMVACTVALGLSAASAHATTHLVSPGHTWPAATKNLRPGDEILLLPGEHRPAVLQSVHGERELPIIVRSADMKNPSVIKGGHIGLQLSNCRNVIVRNVVIAESTLCGMQLDARLGDVVDELSGAVKPEASLAVEHMTETGSAESPETQPGSILVEGVMFRKIGPKGARHGVSMLRQKGVRVVNCTFEGWGGAAVEVVASRDVAVQECVLSGTAECTQFDGIQVRAGSEDVRIEANSFQNAGVHAVRIGGQSKLDEFSPPLPETTDTVEMGTIFESSRVTVMHNIIVGSDCAVALSHARRCQVRNNTIVTPREMVFAAAREQEDPRFSDLDSCLILGNLVTWEAGTVSGLFLSTLPLRRQQLALDVNLWWTEDCNERHGPMTKFAVEDHAEQLWETDPRLDDRFRPRQDDAQLYGVPLDADLQPRVRMASGIDE